MTTRQESLRTQVRWASGTNVVLGLWLIAAPFVVLYYRDSTAAAWNDVIVGLLVLSFAWYRSARPASGVGLSWANAVLGLWEAVAPFTLGYSGTTAAVWNDVVVGLAILVLATWSASSGSRLGDRRFPSEP